MAFCASASRRSPGRRTPASAVIAATSVSIRSSYTERPASAPGSMTRNAWPSRGRLPSSTKRVDASKPSAAPASVVTRSSTMSASIAPLVPPMASMLPSRPARASAVGLPFASSAQPSGIGRPSFAAIMSLPRATSDRDMSISRGRPCARGNTAAMGLVPSSGRLPPATGMAAGEFDKARPTMPAAPTGAKWKAATP